jgi:UDP-N-acetylglucosamine--N-acetylmuramyl-(pentapeptide) pyrophosphoryl-undecaprenol N-acetylglucosamine transferase
MRPLERVLIIAGGTGGHVFPGLAVAHALQAHGIQIEWLGTPTGIEAQLVPAANIPITYIKVRGLRGMGWQRWLRAPFDLMSALLTALKLLKNYKPDLVIGMGGFSAGPAGVACLLTRTPLVIHEQNSIAGFTNRVLTHWAKKTLLGLPQADHSHALKQGVVTGNPVRTTLLQMMPPAQRFQERTGALRILVLGGSQGALALNNLIPQALAKVDIAQVMGKGIEVWHQTGPRLIELAKKAYSALSPSAPIEVRLVPFIDDMADAYGWADLVICRSGALTVAELAVAGMPALLIPFPAAIDDHQTYNALYLVKTGGARLLPQRKLTAEQLAELIQQLGSDRQLLQQMAVATHTAGYPRATETIIKEIMDLQL